MAALRDPDFWGDDGRLGVITQGAWTNRLILVYPDALGTWTFIASSSAEEEMLDFYPISDQAAGEVIAELGIVWLARNLQENQLEDLNFDQRSHLGEDASIRGMLTEAIKRLFRKK
ncbi:hypothetical protein [Arthrobacter sp. Leaf69]|uniref:hypothetical protein n=1 Tax=Arthrobacter sp. Leaf69 TaxID=1736232 RepID=UPI0006F33A9C|nr:hypothetical protein [Arthrobacter sp. Leaf69]KQN86172.1 hypothetical protein ASE96_15030 [Arthrobacter sp. Leaf69]